MIKNLVVGLLGAACGYLTIFIGPLLGGLVLTFLGIRDSGLGGVAYLALAIYVLIPLMVIIGGILVFVKTKSWVSAIIFCLAAGLTIGVIFQINTIKYRQDIQAEQKAIEDQGIHKKVFINIVSVKPIYENHKLFSVLLVMNTSSEISGNFGIYGTYVYPSGSTFEHTPKIYITPNSKTHVELDMPTGEIPQNERNETTITIEASKEITMSGIATQPTVPVEIIAPPEMILIGNPRVIGDFVRSYTYKFPDFSWEN